jgi:hypothetical protein
VFVGTRDDVGRAADECLQRLRAAAEIQDGNIQALFLEMASRSAIVNGR